MRKEERPQVHGFLRSAAQIGFGTAAAFAITVLLLILSAFGISCGLLQERHIPQITVIASVLGVFMGASLTNSEKKMWHGVFVGVCFILFLVMIKTLLYRSYEMPTETITMIAVNLCAGALSGFATKGKRKGRERGRKHIRK